MFIRLYVSFGFYSISTTVQGKEHQVKSRGKLPCGFSENLLIAVALGEAAVPLAQRVEEHLGSCSLCGALLSRYRSLCLQLDSWPQVSEEEVYQMQSMLRDRLLSSQRHRLLVALWHSPLGDLRIGKTDRGVAWVEFVTGEGEASRLTKKFALEEGDLEDLFGSLREYLEGKRKSLGWTVDGVLIRSPFQREVLRATAEIPYGTVVTYRGIAQAIGRPQAVRAVARALRFNPLPIQIPCHRVVGSDGNLTGYAGKRLELKGRLLALEGVPVIRTSRGLYILKDQMYLGWQREGFFCLPTCPRVEKLRPLGPILIPSQARAEELGFLACKVCHPESSVRWCGPKSWGA